MAQTPQWKVYRGGEYVAAFKFSGDAALFVSASGGSVKYGHSLIVWHEGEKVEAVYRAAEIMERRRYDSAAAAYQKAHGSLPA